MYFLSKQRNLEVSMFYCIFSSSVWPGLIRGSVFTLLRTVPVITIKQLLSLDIIKAGQNVEGGVNPPVAERPKSEREGGGVRECGWGVNSGQTDRRAERHVSV